MRTNNAVRTGDNYFPQIDFIKALGIVSVILLHTLASLQTHKVILAQFHIRQAVPVFFIIMGITSTISFLKTRKTTLAHIYSLQYFVGRFWRIMFPFSIAFVISLAYAIWHGGGYYVGWQWIIGLLPVSGPGNYFVTILIQYIFVAPLIFLFYEKSPKLAIGALFAIDIIFQISAPHIQIFKSDLYLYSACIFRYFSALALGFYIAKEFLRTGHIDLKGSNNRFILLLFPVSVAYLVMWRFTQQPFPLFLDVWGEQNVFSFFYPLMLVILAFNNWQRIHLEEHRRLNSALVKIGEASYHIFLVQMLFFGFGLSFYGGSHLHVPFVGHAVMHIRYLSQLAGIVLNLICTISLGFVFFFIEGRVSSFLRTRVSSQWQ